MSSTLDFQVEQFDRNIMRDMVSEKVKFLRKEFRFVPLKLNRFLLNLSNELKEEWEIKNKLFIKENKGEKPLQRLTRWKDMSKEFRLKGLSKLSDAWYASLWKLRSELALITALYEFSEIKGISEQKLDLINTSSSKFKPIVLRMKGPRKPTKKKFLMRDLKYNIAEAFLEMTQPLEVKTLETKDLIDKLVAPKKQLSINIKIKRYKSVFMAREYMTLITQSVAPRQASITTSI